MAGSLGRVHGVSIGLPKMDAIVEALDHLVLTVADIERTVEFYERVLGMRCVSFGNGRRALHFGEQKVNLHRAGHEFAPMARRPIPGSADVCFVITKDLEEVTNHLRDAGVEVEQGPVECTGARGPTRSLYIRDPDGNLVELARYDDVLAVRDAQPGDAAVIARIGRAVWPLVHEHLLGPECTGAVLEQTYSDDAVTEAIECCAAAPDAHFLVAEHGGRVVGYLHYDNFGEEPELHRIYTDPFERQHGAGTALIEELHTRLGPDVEYVLMVAADNTAAQHFYRHHGLIEERRVDATQFYRKHMGVNFPPDAPAVPAIVMRRRAARAT